MRLRGVKVRRVDSDFLVASRDITRANQLSTFLTHSSLFAKHNATTASPSPNTRCRYVHLSPGVNVYKQSKAG